MKVTSDFAKSNLRREMGKSLSAVGDGVLNEQVAKEKFAEKDGKRDGELEFH